MGIIEDFIARVKHRENLRFDKDVAGLIGVNKESLAGAKLRGQLPSAYIKWYCKNYNIESLDLFYKDIKLTKTTMDIGGYSSMEATKIIENQDKLINYQGDEINTLKEALKQKQGESTHWDLCEYDFIAEVHIKLKKMQLSRTIKSIDNFQPMVDQLGYSKKELERLWAIGEDWHDFNDHPIEAIVDEETKKKIAQDSKTLPIIFSSLKNMIGNHYIPQPIIYIHKNGTRVPSISYNKINWIKMIVYSKVKFLNK